MNILRLGAFQILYLDRVPASAAVNTSVDMAKSAAAVWTVRFVNGVLRNLARNAENVRFPEPDKDSVAAMSVEKSLPAWLVKRWLKRFHSAETEALCDAVNTVAPITLRANTLRTDRIRLLHGIRDDVAQASETPHAPEGIRIRRPRIPIQSLPAFEDGWFQVQDEAAQLVSLLLDPRPGETVLDACAGLGGKTGHLAQLMEGQGTLIAMDRAEGKLKRLDAEMDRLGIVHVKTECHDLNTPLGDHHINAYHRVLLDAPCSGLGVLRRNPDAKWRVTEADLEKTARSQARFLDRLSGCVRIGGRLVYAVCSFEPEETDAVVKQFLKHHSDFDIDTGYETFFEAVRPFIRPEGYFASYPHRHDMDGFFAARFKRTHAAV
jgi:16S rRNA (cytosine967-C5)-methyltransferase